MNKALVRKIRTAAIDACLECGIDDPKDVRKILRQARETVQPMSVAGVKAANTKGQYTAYIN